MNNTDNFYNGYHTEENGEDLLELEQKADKIAEEIEELEFDLEEDFNHGNVKRLETLNNHFNDLEEKISVLKYVNFTRSLR